MATVEKVCPVLPPPHIQTAERAMYGTVYVCWQTGGGVVLQPLLSVSLPLL